MLGNRDLERMMYKRAKAHITELKASHAVRLSAQPSRKCEEAVRYAD